MCVLAAGACKAKQRAWKAAGSPNEDRAAQQVEQQHQEAAQQRRRDRGAPGRLQRWGCQALRAWVECMRPRRGRVRGARGKAAVGACEHSTGALPSCTCSPYLVADADVQELVALCGGQQGESSCATGVRRMHAEWHIPNTDACISTCCCCCCFPRPGTHPDQV